MKHLNKSVVTGVNSGLGKYIFENWAKSSGEEEPVGLNRSNSNSWLDSQESYDHYNSIIHCAFNSSKNVEDYKSYIEDNIFMTLKLCDLKYNKFVYISTVDVYSEEENYYNITNKVAECIVISRSQKHCLVLRCSAILGPTMRPNSLTRIINDEDAQLSLSEDSRFNYVLQKDILKFIKDSEKNNCYGVVDFVSEEDVTLGDISRKYNKSPKFGSYKYESVGLNYTLEKPSRLSPYYKKTSEQVIEEFING